MPRNAVIVASNSGHQISVIGPLTNAGAIREAAKLSARHQGLDFLAVPLVTVRAARTILLPRKVAP